MLETVMNFFLGWKVKLAIVLIVLASLFAWHKHEVSLAVVRATTQIELQYAQEKFKLLDKANTSTIELRDQVAQIEKERNAKIKTLNTRIATLTRSLSERPERPTSASRVPGNSGNSESSGFVAADRLYRNDAQVAIWFAARTEGLKVELQSCYNQYDTVRDKLEKFRKENYKSN